MDLHFCLTCSESQPQPVYETPPLKYTAEKILQILLDPTIPEEKICKTKPTGITSSATFVVDIRCMQHPDDIKKDEFGIWKYSGSHPQAYKVYYEEDDISVEKCGSNERSNNVVHLRRLHCTHPSNPQFKRLICFVSGKLFGQKGMKVQYCRYMLT